MNPEEIEKRTEYALGISRAVKDDKMYYGKLEQLFEEICKAKKLDIEDQKHQMIKNFVENNKKLVSEKYYLKYYGDDNEILIFGDNGKYYELSDGSKIDKRIFEKMFKHEKTGDIEVNPYDFWNYNAINFKFVRGKSKQDEINEQFSNFIKANEKVKQKKKYSDPIDPEKFNTYHENFVKKLKEFFDDIDTSKIKYTDGELKVKENKSNYKYHNQNEEWKKSKKKNEKRDTK